MERAADEYPGGADVGVDRRRFLGAMGAGLLMTGGTAEAAPAPRRVFFGAYTTWSGGAQGIGIGTYDTAYRTKYRCYGDRFISLRINPEAPAATRKALLLP